MHLPGINFKANCYLKKIIKIIQIRPGYKLFYSEFYIFLYSVPGN
jgi:hypothetical protein